MVELASAESRLMTALRAANQPVVDLRTDRTLLDSVSEDPSNLLYRLHRKGIAHPLQRGRFWIQLDGRPAPRPRFDSLDPLAEGLLRRFGRPYLISWHSALWRHGLVDQQSLRLYVAVAARKRPARIGRVVVDFVFVAPDKLSGADPKILRSSGLRIATVEKALIDALVHPELAGGISTVISAMAQAWSEQRLRPAALVDWALNAQSPTLNRRLGYLMDELSIPGSEPLLPHLGRKYAVPLAPGGPTEGKANSKWRLYEDPVSLYAGLHQR